MPFAVKPTTTTTNMPFAAKPISTTTTENGMDAAAALSVKSILPTLDGVTLETCDGSEEARYQLLEASRRLIARLETPFERIWYHTWVSLNNLAIFRIMTDLGLWEGWRAAGCQEASLDELLGYCKRGCDKSLFRMLTEEIFYAVGWDG
ncbi:O-methyltransferase [Colletotrichum tofieldiae]|nr:O-methyltransferase [Colletotrichum tofieldiae]